MKSEKSQTLIKKIFKIVPLLLILLGMLILLPAGRVQAQYKTPEIPDDQVNAIAKEMYCPVCENIPLDVCGTQACFQWRELIRQKLGEGWSEQQIKDYFVAQYGDRVLAEPPRRGLNWLAYLVPPFAVLVAIFLVVRVLRSWQVSTAETKEAGYKTDKHQDEYMNRVEEELRKRD